MNSSLTIKKKTNSFFSFFKLIILPLRDNFTSNNSFVFLRNELFERVTCRHNGEGLYSFEKSIGLRAKISFDNGSYIYCVDEPQYSYSDVNRVLSKLIGRLNEKTHTSFDIHNALDPRTIDDYIEAKILTGLGKIYPLILDPNIEEIALNRPSDNVFINHKSLGLWIKTNIRIEEPEASRLALSMSDLASRPLSIANPVMEGSSKLGLRFAVTLGDGVTPRGTSFVIRKTPSQPLSIPELIKSNFITPLQASYLWFLLEKRGFIIILGGMATGKTTLLQAILDLMPSHMRIVTIEDTPEIRLVHPNWDSLVIHKGFSVGSSSVEYSMFDLARFALRRRSDFVVIGEVRGDEAKVLLQASITGHGSLCLHPKERIYVLDGNEIKRIDVSEVVKKLMFGEPIKVLSISGEGIVAWRKPTRWLVTTSNNWIILKTEKGVSLRATPDHLVPTLDKDKISFKRVDEIRIGEKVLYIDRVASLDKLTNISQFYTRVVSKEKQKFDSRAFDLTLDNEFYMIVHSSGIVSHNCSFHADDVETAVTRLTSPPISVPLSSLRNVWSFVTLGFRDNMRRVVSLSETDPYNDDFIIKDIDLTGWYNDKIDELLDKSERLKRLAHIHGLSKQDVIDELALRTELLSSLARRATDAFETRKYIESFYSTRLRRK